MLLPFEMEVFNIQFTAMSLPASSAILYGDSAKPLSVGIEFTQSEVQHILISDNACVGEWFLTLLLLKLTFQLQNRSYQTQ